MRLIACLLVMLGLAIPTLVMAQSPTPIVISSCGSRSLTASRDASPAVDTTGNLCTNASASGSTTISGPLGRSADASSVSSALSNEDVAILSAPAGVFSVVTSPIVTPTITASTYATGVVLGGIMSFTGQPSTGIITNANVAFNSGTFTDTVDIYLFNASPTGGGTTDHAAFALTSTDSAKLIGILHAADCTSYNTTLAQCQVLYQAQVYTLAASGTTIYGVAVVRGSWAGSFAGTTDAIFSLNVIK